MRLGLDKGNHQGCIIHKGKIRSRTTCFTEINFSDLNKNVHAINGKNCLKAHLMLREESDTLQLVEHWVVLGVDLVAPVDIAHHQEGIQPSVQEVPLVCRCVCSQHVSPVQVIVVSLLPAGVVSWDEQAVKVLPGGDHWRKVIIDGEQRSPEAAHILLVEVLLHPLLDQPEWVMLLVVQIPADLGEDLPGEVAIVILRIRFAQQLHHATWSSSGSRLRSSRSRAQGLTMMAFGDTTGLPHQVSMHLGNSPES